MKKRIDFHMNLLNTLNDLIYFWKIRYFIVKSCNRENLEFCTTRGVWATQRSNEAKLNEAFDSADNVILIFSVNRTRHFQVLTIPCDATWSLMNIVCLFEIIILICYWLLRVVQIWCPGLVVLSVGAIGNMHMELHIMVKKFHSNGLRLIFHFLDL